jgi:hypothetical protein
MEKGWSLEAVEEVDTGSPGGSGVRKPAADQSLSPAGGGGCLARQTKVYGVTTGLATSVR